MPIANTKREYGIVINHSQATNIYNEPFYLPSSEPSDPQFVFTFSKSLYPVIRMSEGKSVYKEAIFQCGFAFYLESSVTVYVKVYKDNSEIESLTKYIGKDWTTNHASFLYNFAPALDGETYKIKAWASGANLALVKADYYTCVPQCLFVDFTPYTIFGISFNKVVRSSTMVFKIYENVSVSGVSSYPFVLYHPLYGLYYYDFSNLNYVWFTGLSLEGVIAYIYPENISVQFYDLFT